MPLIRCQTAVFSDITAVLFDKDGTLAHSAPFLRDIGRQRIQRICARVSGIQNELYQAFGLSHDGLRSDGLLAVGTRYENEIAAATYIAASGYGWADSLALAQAAFAEADVLTSPKAPQTPLFPGTRDFLDTLQHHGLALGLLSADSSHHVHDFLQTYQLVDYFQFATGIDQPPGKPDPSLITMACNALTVPASQLLVIGDAPVDIQLADAGHTAGCIAMSWNQTEATGLEQAGAIAHTFSDIEVQSLT